MPGKQVRMTEKRCFDWKHLQEHLPHRSNRLEESQGEQELHYFPVLQQLIWEQRLKMVRTCLQLKIFLCLMVTKEYRLKAGTSYSVGLEFMEEERRMARKYHEEGMREES